MGFYHSTLAFIIISSFFIYIQLHGKQSKEGFRIDGGRIYLNSIYFNLKTWNQQVSGFRCSGRAFIQYTYIILERRSGLSDLESTSEIKSLSPCPEKKICLSIQSRNKLIYSFSYFNPRTSCSSLTQKYTHLLLVLVYPRNILIYFLFQFMLEIYSFTSCSSLTQKYTPLLLVLV